MLMKHYAPDRCEPSIEALNFGGGGGGGVRVDVYEELRWGIRADVNGEVKFFVKIQKYFFFGGGGGRGVGGGGSG